MLSARGLIWYTGAISMPAFRRHCDDYRLFSRFTTSNSSSVGFIIALHLQICFARRRFAIWWSFLRHWPRILSRCTHNWQAVCEWHMMALIPSRLKRTRRSSSTVLPFCMRVTSAASIPAEDSSCSKRSPDRLPWLSLHIVGNWHNGVDAEDGSKAVPSNVHVHGFLPYADAERVRMACDVLLAPYRRQVYTSGGSDISRWMSPLKIFEYMAAGKAIVCSNIAVLHEVLTHKENAWFCPPDDIDAWCAALTKMRDDEGLRLRIWQGSPREVLPPAHLESPRSRRAAASR